MAEVVRARRHRTRLLHPPALGREGIGGGRTHGAGHARPLRARLRLDTREGSRPLGRCARDRKLPRNKRRLRPGLVAFAEAYADQNERDYDALKLAVDSGRITAETGL